MSQNPVDDNLALQAVLVAGVVLFMVAAGQALGTRFLALDFPYAGTLGFGVGATLVFVVVALVYRWSDAYLA